MLFGRDLVKAVRQQKGCCVLDEAGSLLEKTVQGVECILLNPRVNVGQGTAKVGTEEGVEGCQRGGRSVSHNL